MNVIYYIRSFSYGRALICHAGRQTSQLLNCLRTSLEFIRVSSAASHGNFNTTRTRLQCALDSAVLGKSAELRIRFLSSLRDPR
jgi:hypothetical protein